MAAPAPATRIIAARSVTLCKVCSKNIDLGTKTAHKPGLGWVHYPNCFVTPVSPQPRRDAVDKWDDLEDDDSSDAEAGSLDIDAAVREKLGVAKKSTKNSESNATADEIEAKLFDELKRITADQNRLVKGMVKAQMQESFSETMPELLKQVTTSVKNATSELVKAKLEEARREFKGETQRAIAKIAGSGLVKQVIEIKQPDGTSYEVTGEVFHPRFGWIMQLAMAGKPIFLPGPTGSGKTHIAMQLARAIYKDNWEANFGILSCSPATAERHFLGRSIPKITTGEDIYRSADFVRIYEEGGVFCLDEMDAGDPSVFIVINAALANGFLAVPDRTDKPVAKRHPNFVLVACANTFGRGADRKYVGRNPIDEATIDRFRIGTVPINYSKAIEMAVCPDSELYDTLHAWRAGIFEHRLERVLSTRFMKDAFDMKQRGASMDDITRALFSGWRKEEVVKVLGRELPDED